MAIPYYFSLFWIQIQDVEITRVTCNNLYHIEVDLSDVEVIRRIKCQRSKGISTTEKSKNSEKQLGTLITLLKNEVDKIIKNFIEK